jgi:hypothetical protein
MRVLARDEEVEPLLLVQNEAPEPSPWMKALGFPQWYQFTFTTVAEAPKFMDSSTVGVSGYEGGRRTLATRGHFFSVYALLDEAARAAYSDNAGITLADRHRAAALASASGAIGADVIVTAAPTVGRDDVADNDLVVSVTPTQLIPLFGHYLRMTGNSVLTTTKGQLVGGGTFLQTLNATSVADLYLAGINASTPHLNAIQLMATVGAPIATSFGRRRRLHCASAGPRGPWTICSQRSAMAPQPTRSGPIRPRPPQRHSTECCCTSAPLWTGTHVSFERCSTQLLNPRTSAAH